MVYSVFRLVLFGAYVDFDAFLVIINAQVHHHLPILPFFCLNEISLSISMDIKFIFMQKQEISLIAITPSVKEQAMYSH